MTAAMYADEKAPKTPADVADLSSDESNAADIFNALVTEGMCCGQPIELSRDLN